ncbi:MAG: histidine kinase [Ignavibacteriales bacterium]|nr:histidine kinase [Ignavibacteriales bacterium]
MAHIDVKRWLWWRISLPPLIHLFGDIMGYIFYTDVVRAHYTGDFWFLLYLKELAIITIGLYIVSEGNVYAYLRLDSIMPWEQQPRKRLVFQLLFATGWVILSATIISAVLAALGQEDMSVDLLINMTLMSLMVTVGVIIIFFFQKMKSSWLEAAQLKRETSVAQDHALRQQTDPHFLFNSLNTLTSLIMEDSELAIQYVGRLSNVYRYVLQSKERSVVSLHEELAFVRDFAFGFSLRFEDSFQLSIDIPDRYLDSEIPPLTLQILVDNCVKHNVVSKEKPLRVRINVSADGYLVVANNLQRKPPESPRTQIGLKNIIARYQLLTAEIIQITEGEAFFTVRLPLLAKDRTRSNAVR